MSASRKKQERKNAEEPVISSRAREEMEKEAQRKRNTLIYSIIGVVVVILVAILLIWNSGIIQRSTSVAEIGGEKVTAGEVAYYYYNNDIIYYAQLYSSYGYTGYPYSLSQKADEQIITEDAATELGLDTEYVGQTYHEYFLDYALNSLRETRTLCAAAKDAGYTLSDEGKASIDEAFADLDSNRESYLTSYGADLSRSKYLQLIYGTTMNANIYKQCLENATLAEEYYTNCFDSLADYSQEELDSYYQDNKASLDSVTYYWRQFAPDSDAEDTEAALAEAREAADAALAEIEADPDLVRDNEDYTRTSGVMSAGTFYYDWLLDDARVSGDATVLDGGTAYYLLVFEDRFLDESNTVNIRHILVQAKNEDDPATEDVDESTEDPTDEAFAAAEEKAKALLEQWKSGDATEESFAALVADNSADSGSNTNGGLYEKVAQGQMISGFNDWIFDSARQSGDTGMVKNTESYVQGWHIIYYIGEDEPVWITSARQALLAAEIEAGMDIVRTDKLDLVLN